jgi:uncharacterized Tic20 family protein
VSTNLPASNVPTQEERILAALAHASILIPLTGLIASIVIWTTQKDKSPYVSFQALQAVAYHLTLIVATFAGGACYFCSSLGILPLLFFATPSSPNNQSSSPSLAIGAVAALGVLLPLLIFGAFLIVMAVFVLTGIFAAVRTLQGKPFRYFILGHQLERYLQQSPSTSQSSP